jgi:hypothetical protein
MQWGNLSTSEVLMTVEMFAKQPEISRRIGDTLIGVA